MTNAFNGNFALVYPAGEDEDTDESGGSTYDRTNPNQALDRTSSFNIDNPAYAHLFRFSRGLAGKKMGVAVGFVCSSLASLGPRARASRVVCGHTLLNQCIAFVCVLTVFGSMPPCVVLLPHNTGMFAENRSISRTVGKRTV